MHKLLYSSIALLICITARAQDRQNYYSSLLGVNSEPVLFNAITMNTYELLNTSIQISKDESLQKVVLSPFQLLNKNKPFLDGIKINLAQKEKISTIGIGFGVNTASPFSKRGNKKFKSVQPAILLIGVKPSQNSGETDDVFRAKVDAYDAQVDNILSSYYEDLIKNSIKLTASYNLSLFEIIGGKEIDADQDGIIDNKHSIESNNYTIGGIYSINVKNNLSLNVHYMEKRSGAEEGKKVVPFIGGSFAFATTIYILDKDYRSSKDYLKSLFIPSILFGGSIEYLKATDNQEDAKDGISKSLVITPFLDFKITPKSQFRLGIPIARKTVSKEGSVTSLGPMLQLLIQISDQQ